MVITKIRDERLSETTPIPCFALLSFRLCNYIWCLLFVIPVEQSQLVACHIKLATFGDISIRNFVDDSKKYVLHSFVSPDFLQCIKTIKTQDPRRTVPDIVSWILSKKRHTFLARKLRRNVLMVGVPSRREGKLAICIQHIVAMKRGYGEKLLVVPRSLKVK